MHEHALDRVSTIAQCPQELRGVALVAHARGGEIERRWEFGLESVAQCGWEGEDL
jgi:hypothetical protein